ncbi:sensor histidine kinase [Microscilla marina]|uniref:Sensor histidine kinase n=1 Tax=Microscilla marina ATCC 23134 TaxID=313606 RepID=A1ZP20_MICM2|nr:histidine kinase [Microscilla marina]EAY27812.1 sensor histidine kinase [Microscilla marina ATCC 23134]
MDKTEIIKRKYVVVTSIILWLIVASVSISESVFFYKVNNRPVPMGRILIWDISWVMWLLMTPYVLQALQYFLGQVQQTWRVITNVILFAFLISVAQVLFETLLAYFLYPIFDQAKPFTAILLNVLTYKTHINILIVFALAGITTAIRHWQNAKHLQLEREQQQVRLSQLQQQLTESKLELLRRQLKPHFLFNTLHTISGLIIKEAYDQSLEMIAKLSDLLRLTLHYNDQQLIPLREEIKLMRLYLEIHQIRFGDDCQLNINVPQCYESALVPSFILQPIAENAITHGVVPNMNKGCISLSVRCENETLYIEIADNGVGLKDGEALKEGIGIQNCRKRLDSLYKQKHGLDLEVKNEGGFSTVLYFPYQDKELKTSPQNEHQSIDSR